jgi:hypothetical protein
MFLFMLGLWCAICPLISEGVLFYLLLCNVLCDKLSFYVIFFVINFLYLLNFLSRECRLYTTTGLIFCESCIPAVIAPTPGTIGLGHLNVFLFLILDISDGRLMARLLYVLDMCRTWID